VALSLVGPPAPMSAPAKMLHRFHPHRHDSMKASSPMSTARTVCSCSEELPARSSHYGPEHSARRLQEPPLDPAKETDPVALQESN